MTRTAPFLLLVDDDAAIARGLASELAAQGYETVMATDGQQGLEVFSARHPDLVVTDDAMPRLDCFGIDRPPLRGPTAGLRRGSVGLRTSFGHLPDFLGSQAAAFGA